MKKKTEERLLEELKFKAKRAEIAPDKFSCLKGGTLLTGDDFEEEIKNSMVDVVNYDDGGFLYLKINPKIQRDILHHLIDKAIDEYPQEVLERKAVYPDLTMREFLDRYYQPIIIIINGYPIFIPTLPLTPAKKNNASKRFRSEQLKALEVWEEWKKSGLSGKRGFPKIAKKLGRPLSTVKSQWYTAHKLVKGKPFDSQEVKGEFKERAIKLCSKCEDAKCYKVKGNMEWIPCPEYLALTGKEYQREKSMTERQVCYSHFGEIDIEN